MVKRLLIVEDDFPTRRLLKQVLEDAGFQVTAVGDGSEALSALQKSGLPHLILMDLGLPGMHGFVVSEQVKRMGDVPIIMVTGDTAEDDVVYGLENYADDYITKPFVVREVVARIQRVLSRVGDDFTPMEPVITVDEYLSIDFAHSRVRRDEHDYKLTPIEASLLYILIKNSKRTVTPETLIARTWPTEEVDDDVLRVHMHRLRSKIQTRSSFQYIQTERGTGYSFHSPDD